MTTSELQDIPTENISTFLAQYFVCTLGIFLFKLYYLSYLEVKWKIFPVAFLVLVSKITRLLRISNSAVHFLHPTNHFNIKLIMKESWHHSTAELLLCDKYKLVVAHSRVALYAHVTCWPYIPSILFLASFSIYLSKFKILQLCQCLFWWSAIREIMKSGFIIIDWIVQSCKKILLFLSNIRYFHYVFILLGKNKFRKLEM